MRNNCIFQNTMEDIEKMKRINWLLVKFAFVLVSLVFIYGYGLHNVFAQRGNCNTSQACSGTIYCNCGDSDCGGCYIPNGASGCGSCSKGSEEILLD